MDVIAPVETIRSETVVGYVHSSEQANTGSI